MSGRTVPATLGSLVDRVKSTEGTESTEGEDLDGRTVSVTLVSSVGGIKSTEGTESTERGLNVCRK